MGRFWQAVLGAGAFLFVVVVFLLVAAVIRR